MAYVYKREKSKYYWVSYTINGKQKYESTKCERKMDADRLLKEKYIPLEVNSHNNHSLLVVHSNLHDALEKFKNEVLEQSEKGTKAKNTIKRDKGNIQNFQSYLESKDIKKFEHINEETIRDYVFKFCAIEQKKKPNSLIRDLRIAKMFFVWCIKQNYTNNNPCENVKVKKQSLKTPRYLSKDELESVLNNAKEPYRTMFELLYLTGCRVQELLNVKWNDYIEHNKQIIIKVQEGNKTKRETIVNLNSRAIAILEELKKVKGENIHIFTNSLGNQYNQRKLYNYAKSLYKRLNIKEIEQPLHIYRHTCASHMIMNNVSLYIVSKHLRHASIRETEIYAHLSKEKLVEAIETLCK